MIANYFILKPLGIAVGNSILRKVLEENFSMPRLDLKDYQDGSPDQSKRLNVTELKEISNYFDKKYTYLLLLLQPFRPEIFQII